jgi:hypothetical protein
MITIHLQGGLGNQLFQIFTTISYALQLNMSFFFFNQTNLTNRRHTYWDTFLYNLKPFIKDTSNIPLSFINELSYNYNNISNDLKLTITNSTAMLVGYFQSYKYFHQYSHQIYRLIKLQEKQNIIRNMFIHDIDFNNTISLHFRLGDYKILKDVYILLDEKYYCNAISYILQTNNPTKVIYFYEKQDQEDIEVMVNKLKIIFPQLLFQACPDNLQDYEQLLLMSQCKYNIIANSTFSWWAAYFNQCDSKIVCYPFKWFVKMNNTEDLFPADWIKIDF